MDASQLDARKARAKTWFEALRDDICAAFERLEAEAPAALYGSANAGSTGRFVRTPWSRTDHTAGRYCVATVSTTPGNVIGVPDRVTAMMRAPSGCSRVISSRPMPPAPMMVTVAPRSVPTWGKNSA